MQHLSNHLGFNGRGAVVGCGGRNRRGVAAAASAAQSQECALQHNHEVCVHEPCAAIIICRHQSCIGIKLLWHAAASNFKANAIRRSYGSENHFIPRGSLKSQVSGPSPEVGRAGIARARQRGLLGKFGGRSPVRGGVPGMKYLAARVGTGVRGVAPGAQRAVGRALGGGDPGPSPHAHSHLPKLATGPRKKIFW